MINFLLLVVLAAAFVAVFMLLKARQLDNAAYKSVVDLALAAAFLLFWVNSAVGIIGSEDNDANLMYYGVLAVGIIGSLIAGFEPRGMAYAMVATAVAQVLAFVIALVVGWGFTGLVTLFFGALWLGSAQLFRRAAMEASPAGLAAES